MIVSVAAASVQRMVVFGAQLRERLGTALTYVDGRSAQGGEVDVEYQLDGTGILMLTLSDRPGRDQRLYLQNALGVRGRCDIGHIAQSVEASADAVAKLVEETQELSRLKRSVMKLASQAEVDDFGVVTDGLYRYTPTMAIKQNGRIVTVSVVGNETVDFRNIEGVAKIRLVDVSRLHDPHRLRDLLKDLTKTDW